MGYNAGRQQSGWETAAMDQVPTDSVLKRHYAQRQQAGGNAPGSGCCGGLFGWLKKLFCR